MVAAIDSDGGGDRRSDLLFQTFFFLNGDDVEDVEDDEDDEQDLQKNNEKKNDEDEDRMILMKISVLLMMKINSGLANVLLQKDFKMPLQGLVMWSMSGVVTDQVSGYSKGFGFIRYATVEDAAKGIKGMDGKFLDGWVIFTEYARPRPQPPQFKNNAGSPPPGYGSPYGRP
ncbi:hypothetical protein TEA_015977 [Camellia sinensis var. sinensis]|uniref:RRM domain-containing protein n=1 Tax=Camellia sinensis var. sinensis TaxID=542762 RepID=A0A4S4DIB5_CAMSN|nr:hypothetical protein TEA_015977 [Camellia sinensis var. sinensis]